MLEVEHSFELRNLYNLRFTESEMCLPLFEYETQTEYIPEFTRNECNSHCDVLHITPVRVARLVLDDAIAVIQTSR